MTAPEIIVEARRHGVELMVGADGKLKAAPPGRLPAELRGVIREQASAIKVHLSATTPARPQPMTWTQDEGANLIVTVLARCEYQRDQRADAVSRPRIARLMQDFEPVIAGLFEKADYESLRYCLMDLERNIGDALSGRGWN